MLKAPHNKQENAVHAIPREQLKTVERFNSSLKQLGIKILRETGGDLWVKGATPRYMLDYLFFVHGAQNPGVFSDDLTLNKDFKLAELLDCQFVEVPSSTRRFGPLRSVQLNLKTRGNCWAECEAFTEYARTVVFNAENNEPAVIESAQLLTQDVISYTIYGSQPWDEAGYGQRVKAAAIKLKKH